MRFVGALCVLCLVLSCSAGQVSPAGRVEEIPGGELPPTAPEPAPSRSSTESPGPGQATAPDPLAPDPTSVELPTDPADALLLDAIEALTFKYFWDFGHPESGMARERDTSGDTVTTGGSGFGLMALLVGMKRGFITRPEGLTRLTRILTFLEGADRFHGAWAHWMNGKSGKAIAFAGANDNGADILETSFLIQGLLTFRQALQRAEPREAALFDRIDALWKGVEWDWFTRGGEDVLYWHWSPTAGWAMNHQIRGYNEGLITYVLAAASPDHAIKPSVYHRGWARDGGLINGKTFYGIKLPLGPDLGGPLFFAHYSYLGLDPRTLADNYASYWEQNVSQVKINHAYCLANPKGYQGYGESSWGLTASDNHQGYSAHSPTNDLGVISPTAAVASIPYTPEASMRAIRHFHDELGPRLVGPYGFYDAFNESKAWWGDSYIAIDQGPIIAMIENYRSGLLWKLFMSCPEVQAALGNLGFTVGPPLP